MYSCRSFNETTNDTNLTSTQDINKCKLLNLPIRNKDTIIIEPLAKISLSKWLDSISCTVIDNAPLSAACRAIGS